MPRHLSLAALLVCLAAPLAGQGVGSTLPKGTLRDFQQTDATSLDDFYGRALLLEFFAHW